MKILLLNMIGLVILSSSSFATGTEKTFDAAEAMSAVKDQASRFITRTAPDFHGKVHACTDNLNGDIYTVVCTGIAYDTMAGDGDMAVPFNCIGNFTAGQNEVFYQARPITCQNDR